MGKVNDAGDAHFSALTPRERDVMDYVARGKPNKIIAAELGVSQRTVEAHRARIFQKMQVRNAVELAHCILAKRD
jgi:DNA-binding NarL/FixJ family response regulator